MGKRMLLLVVVLVAVGLCGSAALALDPMGPPAAGLKKGQFSAGVDYSYSRMDITHKGKGMWEIIPITSQYVRKSFKVKNVELHQVYANIGYGITDYWETFLRLGAVKVDSEHGGSKFEGDSEFAIGFGTKTTFYEAGNLKLGGLFQASWASCEYRLTLSGSAPGFFGTTYWSLPTKADFDFHEIQIAVGPTYQLMDGVSVYGGPFLHFFDGHSNIKAKGIADTPFGDYPMRAEDSYDVDEVSEFGGYIGMQVELVKNVPFNIEYQHTAAADALAMNLTWRF